MIPVKIIHFHNGSGGGVLSVIRSLLRYRQHPEIENHVIYTINIEQIVYFKKPNLQGAVSERIFYYSPKWNFYYICCQLAKLLPDDNAIIVAHDWLELGMVSNLGLQNPLVHYVHGAYYYYYSLATKHNRWIDSYITVSQNIADELTLRMPEREGSIHYLRFPVEDIQCVVNEKSPGFHIVFSGRCDDLKGYYKLPEIEKELLKRGVKVQWHIAGEGSESKSKQEIWLSESNVKFYGNLAHNDLIKLLCNSHMLILPSYAEGMPLSVVEAMKAGTIPVVNDLHGGIQELVKQRLTGYLIPGNKVTLYADVIRELHNNSILIQKLALKAQTEANKMFNPNINIESIEAIITRTANVRTEKIGVKIYGSRLDHPLIPNIITNTIRSIQK